MFQLDDGIADLLNPYLENLASILDMLRVNHVMPCSFARF